MGFKRTNEGRVFFQNLAGAAEPATPDHNERPLTNPAARQTAASPSAKSDATQMQIVALLKSLNTRLEATQDDREKLQQELETYKDMVLALREKTDAQEREAAKIRKKLNDAENKADVGKDAGKKAQEAQQLSREAIKEFEEARRLILEIEERAERAESQLKKQQIQMRQSEEQARVKFDQLEKKQDKQAQDLLNRLGSQEERQKILDDRIEDSVNATLKIERKIDKAVQERARLIRKLERIEETVLQTNEAMNSRAMVLLTDQALAGQGSALHRPAMTIDNMLPHASGQAQSLPAHEDVIYEQPMWKKSFKMQAVSVSMIVLSAAVLGWGVSELQKPEIFQMANLNGASQEQPPEIQTYAAASNPASSAPSTSAPRDFTQQTTLSNDAAAAFDEMIEQSQPAPRYDVTGASVERLNNDIDAIDLNDEQQVLELLESDPDALAAQLNAIEPSSVPEGQEFAGSSAGQSVTGEMKPSQAEEDNASIASPSSSPVYLATPEAKAALGLDQIALPSTLNGSLSDRISADSSLPANIKSVEDSAFAGDANAQHDLAAIYTAGHAGVKQDYKRAALWFDEAAHNGIANARYNLGVLYHQGIGVKQDTETAFQWYKTAAAIDHPEAQYNLGIAYIEGLGVPYDPLKAATFFESAAKGGVIEAAYNLGLIYENGLLGKAQPDTALFWYKQAADKGSPEAQAALEQLAKTLGLAVADVNQMIDGMGAGAGAPAAQKKTEKANVDAPKASETATSRQNAYQDDQYLLIARIQESLMDMGLYPGPVDGIGGDMTRDAVRTYQSRHELPDNGEITQALLTHMREMGYMLEEGEGNEQGSRE